MAGSHLAPLLAKNTKLQVTVITPFDFLEPCLLMTEIVASGPEEHAKHLYPLLREDNVDYVIGKVAQLTDSSVTLASGQVISFDMAVVATGCKIPIFQMDPDVNTMEARKLQIASLYENIVSANTIIISGGGAIGCEIAADIKLRHPAKRIVLVHTGEKILMKMHPSISALATKKLAELGVELIHNDKVLEFANGEAKLQSGKTIFGEMYIPAHAAAANSSFMPAETLDVGGFIKVDDNLKVIAMQNVFALADVSNRDANKAYIKVDDQVPTIVHNVNAKATNSTMKAHVPGFMGKLQGPLLVAFGHGRKDGYGFGPDLGNSCMSYCCWFCCCGPPAGKMSAGMKSDFNHKISPKKGLGMHE
jgi:NADH dehydrogenase FAD-containing subunit